MSRLIDQLRASDYPDRSARDLTLEYGQYLEQNQRDDIFAANPDFAQEYAALKDDIARARRPGYVDEFKGAFGSAVDELQASGFAIGALAAHGAKAIGVPGAEPVRNNLLRLMKEQQDEAAEFQPSVPSYEKISGQHPIEDTARYLTFGLGTVAPSMLQAAASGLAGAALGSAAGPEGAVAGGLAGLAERRLAQKVLSKALTEGTKDVTLEIAAKTLTKAEIAAEAKRLAVEYGAQAALAATSIGQEVGSIYADNPDAPGAAIGYGIPAGLLDVLPEAYVLSRFFKPGERIAKEAGSRAMQYFKRFAEEAAKTVPMEGSTEAAQTLLEIAAAKHGRGESPTFTDDDYRQALNAGIIGAIGGLGMAPVSAIGGARSNVDPRDAVALGAANRLRPTVGESPGPLDFGMGNEIPEADLASPSPAPLREDALAGIGEAVQPDAAFDPFQTARPAYRSAEVFQANEKQGPVPGLGLYEQQMPGFTDPGVGLGSATPPYEPQPLGPRAVLPDTGGIPEATMGAQAEVARAEQNAASNLPKSVQKAVDRANEASAALERQRAAAAAPIIIPEPAPVVAEPVAPSAPIVAPPASAAPVVVPESRVPITGNVGVAPQPQPVVSNAIPIQSPTALPVREQPEGGAGVRVENQVVQPAPGAGVAPSVETAAGAGAAPQVAPELMTPEQWHAATVAKLAPTNAELKAKGFSGETTPNVSAHQNQVQHAAEEGRPVSAAAVAAYGTKLPPGYVRQGDRYVYVTPPVIRPTGVVTAPTGQQAAAATNGVPALPPDSVPNLRRLRIFEQPKPAPTEDEMGPLPANARTVETVESRSVEANPLVELDKAVGKLGKAESNVAAIIVDRNTGQAYVRGAYRGAGNVLYVDMASTRKGTAVGKGSTVSAEADFNRGTEGRPAQKLFAERAADGQPRYVVYGVGELVKGGGPRNWNVGSTAALNEHPGIQAAAKRYWNEQAAARPTGKTNMPAATADIEAFPTEMAAWRRENPGAKAATQMTVRIAEYAAAQNKKTGSRLNEKALAGWVKSLAATIETIAKVETAQTNRISADYTVPPAAALDLYRSNLRALTDDRTVDVAAFEQSLMGAVDAAAQTTGLVISSAGRKKIVAFGLATINGPVRADQILSLLHETGHHVTDGLSEPLRVAFQTAIDQMPWQQGGWLMNPRSLDIRLLANADPATLSPEQRAAFERLTPEEVAAARRIDPAALLEEQMAEHLAQIGWDKSEAKGAVQKFIRLVKAIWLRLALAVQTALKGANNISPALARAYVENRFLQFIHRDSAFARDRINDLRTWLGVPATERQKVPFFPAGADWDQRMQYVDVVSGELIPVAFGTYTPDAQQRAVKAALDRAAEWVARNPPASTPDTPNMRFTQRAFFSDPFSFTPTIQVNAMLGTINLVDETLRAVAADPGIAPLLPRTDGVAMTADAFAAQMLKVPAEQLPSAMKRALVAAATKAPDPLTGQPVAHNPDITVDELPKVEQKLLDKEGRPKTVQITEAQDEAIKQAILSLRDAERRLTAQLGRDTERFDALTREKERQGRTRGEFPSASQYELSRLGEEVLTRQKIAIRLNEEINALLAKFRPGDIVNVYPGAELLSVPHDSATEDEIRSGRKYRIPLQMDFVSAESRTELGAEISRGEAWLMNEENRNQGQIYGVISEGVRKLRQIAFNQERAAVSAVVRHITGGFVDELNAIGLPSTRFIGKRISGATAFIERYRSDLTTLGRKWSTAFGRLSQAMGRPNDQTFVEELWDPLSRAWNFVDASERAKLGTPSEASIFELLERALATTGVAIKGEKQREALRALTMLSIETERKFAEIFDHHPELQVQDKELGTYRRLLTHGLVTGRRGLARHMESLALRMNPAWSATAWVAEGDQRTFWEAAADLYGNDRAAFDRQMAALFDGYVTEDFVTPLATNNVQTFDVAGSDGNPRKASLLNVRQAWAEADGSVTKFAEILHQLEGAPEESRALTVGFVLGNLHERFGRLKGMLDKQAAAANSGIETLQRQMLDGREANDLPAQWVSYATMDEISNQILLHQLAMQAAFGPDALAPARQNVVGDRRSSGPDMIAAGGELAETLYAAKRELKEIRGRFDDMVRDGLTPKEIEKRMGSDDYGIALRANKSISYLDHTEASFRELHSVTHYLNTDLKAANAVVNFGSTMMLQNPRSGVQQVADILGMIVDLKLSTQTLRGLRSATRTLAGQIGNSIIEAFGQRAVFGIDAANRRQAIGARDSESRVTYKEKLMGMGPRSQMGAPVDFESRGDRFARNVTRLARRGRDVFAGIGSPLAAANEEQKGPKLTAGIFSTITRAAMDASIDAGYDLFADIATRGVDYVNAIPAQQRAQFVKELELGVRDLSAEQLGYFGGWLLNDKAAFASLKAALETQMAGERSVGDFVAKAFRRFEAAQRASEAGRGDGSWEVITPSQFTDIANYTNTRWTLQPNFSNLPAFMQGPLRPLFIFLTWPYLAMRRAALGFTDAQQRMTFAGANSSVADGLKAFFLIAGPATIAGSFAIDWYDKYLLGKRQNLREAPAGTLIPLVGPAMNPAAFIERWARYGTAGLPSDLVNMAVNYDSQRTLSLDNRIVAFNAVSTLFNAMIKTPIQQEGNVTYASVGRPILQSVGGGGVLQYLQIMQNLMGFNNQDAAINARINTGNYLRAAGRELNLPVRVFQGAQGVPTPVTPYLQQMELAALVNNTDLFREAYRNAVQAERDEGHAADAEKRVADNFNERHPLRRLFRQTPTETDYRRMLGLMGEYGAGQVRAAVNSYNRYLTNWFGKKPYYGKADKDAQTVEQLIREATRINSDLEDDSRSLLAIP